MEHYVRRSIINASSKGVFLWHLREGTFERLNPPWQPFTIIEKKGRIEDGGLVTINMKFGPLRIPWTVRHSDYVEGKQFRDVQIKGLFSS